MRFASSGAHDFVAVGGASALGSVASFGWTAPQAAKPAKAASEALSRAMRAEFDERGSIQRVDPAICPFLQSDTARSGDGWRYVRKTGSEL
jgi:hypothetical protein